MNPLPFNTRVFVCYRRTVSGHAGRLADALRPRFPQGWVFVDYDDIQVGVNFEQEIEWHLSGCDVLLVVIHPEWADAAGRRRLDDPADFVRREITIAFDRSINVIPVLIRGAAMPDATVLPSVLRPLAVLPSFVMHDEGWSERLDRLVEALQAQLNYSDRRSKDALTLWKRSQPVMGAQWRGVVRGDSAAVYGMIREFVVGMYPVAVRRGLLLGKAPQEIVLVRQLYRTAGETLVVRLTSAAPAGRVEVLMLGRRSKVQKLAREVVATRLVDRAWDNAIEQERPG